MAGQVLPHSDRGTFGAVIEMSSYSGLATASVRKVLPSAEREFENNADDRGLGCARGTLLALLAESGAALFIYGVWHLWHVLR